MAERTGPIDAGALAGAGADRLPSVGGNEKRATVTTNRLRASIVDLTFLVWAVAVPVAFAGRLLNSDGDLARHIAMGRHMLTSGWIVEDLFSFTRAGERFVTYEWLSQVAFALFHRLGGIAGVAICASLVIAAAYALVVLLLRRQGVDPLLAYLTGIGAALLGAVHWLARPHIFSFVAVAILLFVLHARRRRALWFVVPLFAAWANLHPGFVIGLMLLAAFIAGDLLEAFAARSDPAARAEWLGRARFHGSALAIGSLASLATPHGIALHAHIIGHLGNGYLMDVTSEFMSPNFHMFHGKLFALALLGLVVLLTLSRRRLAFPTLMVLLMLLYGSLLAQRNIPLFGLIVLPLLAMEFDGAWRRAKLRPLDHVRRVFSEGERLGRPGLWVVPIAIVMLVVAASGGRLAGRTVVVDTFDEQRFPVAAVEYAREAGLDARLYHELTWGGYILLEWPGQRIFIDGLTDFFGEELVQDYMTILLLEPGWDDRLADFEISHVLLPPTYQLAYALERDGWRGLYRDSAAVLLERPTGWPAERPRRPDAAVLTGPDRERARASEIEAGGAAGSRPVRAGSAGS